MIPVLNYLYLLFFSLKMENKKNRESVPVYRLKINNFFPYKAFRKNNSWLKMVFFYALL